mmetsp:Transcript_47858/g.152685  ORF Transcript_47858/g.152685 Transcript_47858/m.152685 type:complete len:301 (+) Transcript_47858:1111-2013(+)
MASDCFCVFRSDGIASAGVCSCSLAISIILSACACPASVFTSKISRRAVACCSSSSPKRASSRAAWRCGPTCLSACMSRMSLASWFLVGLWVLCMNSSRIAETVSAGTSSQQSRLPVRMPRTSITAMRDSGWSWSFSTASRSLSTACMLRPTVSLATLRPISVSRVQRSTAQRLRRATGPRARVPSTWLRAGCACGQGRPSRGMKTWSPARRLASFSLCGCRWMSASSRPSAALATAPGAMTSGRSTPHAKGRSRTSSIHSSAGCRAAMPLRTSRSQPRSQVASRCARRNPRTPTTKSSG